MKNFNAGWAVLCAAFASGAAAQTVVEPNWTYQPSREAVENAFPALPLALRIEGYAILSCGVAVTGVLSDCRVETEAPEGLGFSQAAFSLADEFRMSPRLVDGKPVAGGTVRIPIRFVLPKSEPGPNPPRPTSAEAMVQARRLLTLDGSEAWLQKGKALEIERIEEASKDLKDQAVGAAALVAMRSVQDEILVELRETRARIMAATLTAEDLRTLVDDSGRTGVAAMHAKGDAIEANLQAAQRNLVTTARRGARDAICRTRDCTETFAGSPLSPVWVEQPSAAEQQRLTPKMAEVLGISGHADIICDMTVYGMLQACKVTHESPGGFNFSKAALGLASRFRAAPQPAGQDVRRQIPLTIRFPAAEPEPSESVIAPQADAKIDLARKVVLSAKPEVFLQGALKEMFETFAAATESVDDPKLVEETRTALSSSTGQALGQMVDEMSIVYSTHFSADELEDILTYLSSPAYARLMETAPVQLELWGNLGPIVQMDVGRRAGRKFCKTYDCRTPPVAATPRSPRP